METDAVALIKKRPRLLIPKEHGAWGIFLVPFAIGLAIAGEWSLRAFLLLGTGLFFFIARYPLVLWARTRFRKFPDHALPTLLFSTGHGLFLALLLLLKFHVWLVLPLGGVGLVFLAGHLYLVSRRQERTDFGELMGVCALTVAAPAAFYVTTGTFGRTALLLWLLCILYFGSGIFYVKMRLGSRTHDASISRTTTASLARPLVLSQVIVFITLAVLSIVGLLPTLTFLAFVPVTVWMIPGIFKRSAQLNVKKMGWTLVAHSVLFAIILGTILRLGA